MGRFTNFLNKIPFMRKTAAPEVEQMNNVEKQYNKAKELIEHGISEEAIKALNQIADIGMMEVQYQQYGCEALKILGEVYETGKYQNIKAKVDRELAAKYYERYIKLVEDGNLLYKLGLLMLDVQNFSKAISYLEKAASYNVNQAFMRLGDIYEKGLNRIDENGQKWRRMGNICWFTNIDIEKRHEEMKLFKSYTPEEYPHYDNYDAIEVSKTADIPCDYYGVIGVPITFMTKHNPEQFSIVGVLNSGSANKYDFTKAVLNGKQLYARILIQRKQVNTNEN